MQQDVCSHCPEYKPSSPTMPTGDLLYAGLITLFIFACGLYYYLTNDALTEEDEFLLRERLHHLDLDRLFPKTEKNPCLTLVRFVELVDESDAGFTEAESKHIFHIIDSDDSNSITRPELELYITKDGAIDPGNFSKMAQQKQVQKQNKGDSGRQVGSTVMKLKIFFGFTQCMSGAAVVFDVPWPPFLRQMMKLMELTSFDIYAVFGEVSCTMQTGFTQKFIFHMLLGPMLGTCIFLVWKIILCRKKHCLCKKRCVCLQSRCRPRFTLESMQTNLYTLMQLMAFGLYTGLATRIFRLFKCQKVHQRYFLVGDMSVACFEDAWWNYGYIAVGCIF